MNMIPLYRLTKHRGGETKQLIGVKLKNYANLLVFDVNSRCMLQAGTVT